MSTARSTNSHNFHENHMALWEEERKVGGRDWPEEEREWVKCLTKADSPLADLYRMYSHALRVDVDEVVARGCQAFEPGKGCNKTEALYHLRWAFRFLMRDYAVCHAGRVGAVMHRLGEPWPWRAWRGLAYLLPRLAVGILAGYLFVHGSSGLQWWIERFAQDGHWWVAACLFLVGALLLGVADVQRRVGRRLGPLLVRSGVLFTVGLIYAGAGCATHWMLHCWWRVTFRCQEAVLWAAAALLVAFTVQLFWSDRSIGEPL